jgi:lysyl-tRNA synthetase class 1
MPPSSRTTELQPAVAALAQDARAWPFEEARKVVKRLEKAQRGADKLAPADRPGAVFFETGYGPSGLPHIGTFGEVARTAMVRHAFEVLTGARMKTRLVCFSDDLDGLRKVPDNVPNRDMLAAHLHKPLSAIPDPFSNEYPSFAAHNNARLRRFLDRFGSTTSSHRPRSTTAPVVSTRRCSGCSRSTTR